MQDSLAVANQVAEETCSSMRTVRSFANERAEADMYATKLQATYRLNVKEAIVYAGYAWSTMVGIHFQKHRSTLPIIELR